MTASTAQTLQQTSTLTMTAQLRQAIELLSLSNDDLMRLVDEEADKNPFLRRGATSGPFSGIGKGGSDMTSIIEQTVKDKPSLPHYIADQIGLYFDDLIEAGIAYKILDYLDESGYLSPDYVELAENLDCSGSDIDKVLSQLQQFEPSGVFARNLAETIKIQLQDKGRWDDQMQTLLCQLDLIAAQDWKALQKATGLSEDQLVDRIKMIRSVNPKPGLEFSFSAQSISVPDVLIEKDEAGDYRVELNPDALPRVLFEKQYLANIRKNTRSKEDKEWVSGQVQAASWLTKALDQRAQTVLNVAKEIIAHQQSFLDRGVQGLKPLRLSDIAEKVGVHESTVSRAISNKTMQTPRGVFAMKYFFTGGIRRRLGMENQASEAVKGRIKKLIEAEKANQILSDDKISDLLRLEGVEIARRTVAKYREAMKIPSSSLRRKQKRNRLSSQRLGLSS